MKDFRVEKDFLGEVRVPKTAYYGSFTQRAKENFQISNIRIHKEFIKSLAVLKKAAASTHQELGLLDNKLKNAICSAADEVLEGKFDQDFPLDVFQAGAGTPWNMNMNEVLANRANELLHGEKGQYKFVKPHDHVNMGQSSNDVIPTATRITTINLCKQLVNSIEDLSLSLEAKGIEFKEVLKSARTHLRDAVPITLGQEFNSYASACRTGLNRINVATKNLRKLPIGGTAVGTGTNSHPEYPERMISYLKRKYETSFSIAKNLFEKIHFASDFLEYTNALNEFTVDLNKICNDLMFLSSGPSTGLNEIILPSVEPGSSIMPGKLNPSILESCVMVCHQISGNRTLVDVASKSGNFDLNVYVPVIAFNVFNSTEWLTKAVEMLNVRCIKGITVNQKTLNYYFDYSNSFATILNPILGYNKIAELVQEAQNKNIPIKELVVQRGIITEDQLSLLIEYSTKPNLDLIINLRKEIKKIDSKT